MPATLKEASTTFDKAEAVFHIKCDVHPWMSAYVGVFTHPFYSVTGADGKFTISGPRPGDLRDHRLAREAGDADGLGHGWRHRCEDPGLQVRHAARSSDPENSRMSQPGAVAAPKPHGAHEAHHEELGFWRKYVFSVDHKVIGIQYGITGLLFLLFGFSLMMLMRWQLAYPGAALPLLGRLLGEARMPGGTMLPDFYNELGAMHGTIMVFLGVVPLAVGGFGNFVVPLQIGAPDMAFPRLNMASYWSFFLGGVTMLASFFVPGGAAQAGWTSYTPLAIIAGTGQTRWLIGMVFLITSSLLGAINFITTIIQLRVKGLTLHAIPLLRVGAVRHGLPPAPGLPAARGRGGHAADGSSGRHELLPPERPRRQRPGPRKWPAEATRSSGSTCSGSWRTRRSTS